MSLKKKKQDSSQHELHWPISVIDHKMKVGFFSLSNVSNKLEVKGPCKRRMELDLNRFVFFRQLDKSCSITFMCDIDATA